jgi:hypothetical protein
MSLEQAIARLLGQPDEATTTPLSREESRALAERLRDIVDGEAAHAAPEGPDRGAAAEAVQLAVYLEGSMEPGERAAFEQELAASPHRRESLLSIAAWLDRIDSMQDEPPAAALSRAIALEASSPPAVRRWGMATVIEWLLPRPRLAMVTSALASVAIVAVGLDIALHMSPLMNPASPPAIEDTGDRPPIRTQLPPPVSTIQPLPQGRIMLTAETINAINAYQDKPAPQQLQALLQALARAGAGPLDARNIRSVTLQPGLAERLRQRTTSLPTVIAAAIGMDGTLRLESID